MTREAINQGFATPEQAAAELIRKQANDAKPKKITPSFEQLWNALKAKGVLVPDDLE